MSISINEDIRHIVEAELQPGEKLLWADRPDLLTVKEKTIRTYILVFLLMTVVLLVVSIFDWRKDAEVSAMMMTFIIIACYGVCAFQMARDLKWAKKHAKKITYGLTDNRIIVIFQIPEGLRSVEAWPYEVIKNVGISTHKSAKTYTILSHDGIFKMKDALTIDSVSITEPIETILMKYKKTT